MKIIQEGKIPEDEEFQVSCRNCSTIFIFQRKEARVDSDRDGPYLLVNCPICKREVFKGLQ